MRRDTEIVAASRLVASSPHLDVPVRYVDVVEEADGRADVPHDLGRLWEERKWRGNNLSNPKQLQDGGGNVGGANKQKKKQHLDVSSVK